MQIKWQQKRGQLTTEAKRKQQKEMSFFIQSTLTGFVYVAGLGCLFCASKIITNRWGLFLTVTVFWELEHVANGFIFLVGNYQTREAILSKLFGITFTREFNSLNPSVSANAGRI